MPQLFITFFIGAAAMLALGHWLGRRVRADTDWRRLLAMGASCVVIGGFVAVYGISQESAPKVADAPAGINIAGPAEVLIAIALAWFGALVCGVAWAQALRPPLPEAPAVDPDATIRESTLREPTMREPTLGPPP